MDKGESLNVFKTCLHSNGLWETDTKIRDLDKDINNIKTTIKHQLNMGLRFSENIFYVGIEDEESRLNYRQYLIQIVVNRIFFGNNYDKNLSMMIQKN